MPEAPLGLALVADVVCAYVSKNSLPATDIPELLQTVYRAFSGLGSAPVEERLVPKSTPMVSVKRSITRDFLVCLEDGQSFKSLKRHLMSKYGLSPDQYREKWGLPGDYPMVAPGYAAKRSALAKASGLGEARRNKSKRPT